MYGQIREVMGRARPAIACPWSLMPWRLKSPANWTPVLRRTQVGILREVLALETDAIAEIGKTLAFWDEQKQQVSSV